MLLFSTYRHTWAIFLHLDYYVHTQNFQIYVFYCYSIFYIFWICWIFSSLWTKLYWYYTTPYFPTTLENSFSCSFFAIFFWNWSLFLRVQTMESVVSCKKSIATADLSRLKAELFMLHHSRPIWNMVAVKSL